MDSEKLKAMDEKADQVIANWSFTALAANLLPPPFDYLAVGTVFGKMGARLAEVYETQVSWSVIKNIGKSVAKGIGTVLIASEVGSDLLKYIPGVNIWVALLVQPPMVAAIAHSAGKAFKQYFHCRITEGCDLTPDQIRKLTEDALHQKLNI